MFAVFVTFKQKEHLAETPIKVMYLANFVDLKKNLIRTMYSTNDIFRTIEDDLLICNKFERWHLNLFILFSFHICLIWDLGHICRINPI